MRKWLVASVSAPALGLPGEVLAQDSIKVGILIAREGAFAAGGADGVRKVELTLKQASGMAGGKKIETIVAPTDTTPDTSIRRARKLIEQDGVDFIIGPLSGSEGIAMRDDARTISEKTVINGIAGALETTWVDPADNFFRFAVDFCKAGGDIVERFWVPPGNSDFGGVIAQMPDGVDAIYLGMGGTDAINFLNQYEQAGASTNLIGGTIMSDATVLASRGRAKEALVGTPASGAFAPDNPDPAWQDYLAAHRDFEGDAAMVPSLCGVGYYIATPTAIDALNRIDRDLSDGQTRFHAALSAAELVFPLGTITLNENRQATGSVLVTEVVEGALPVQCMPVRADAAQSPEPLAAFLARQGCDGVLALGGPQAMARALDLAARSCVQVPSRHLPLIALPTTTAALGLPEVPLPAAGNPRRIAPPSPAVVLCDPTLTTWAGPELTAARDLDVMVHCIETI